MAEYEGRLPIGIGILGAAAIARKNVKAIGKTTKGIEIVAVGSRTLSKAEAFVEDTGLKGQAKAYGSYEEVLDAADVDAVYIPLPTAIHLKWVQLAAAKKKHILLEKPIALNIEETDGIVKACAEAGVTLMDGTMFIHHPRTRALEPFVRDPKGLGIPRSITSTFTFRPDQDFFANDVRTRKDGDALGCYGDVGWYCIRAALWAFNYDPPVLVQAHPGSEMNKNGVAIRGGGTVVWKDGRVLIFNCGFTSCTSQYLQITGSEGLVEVPDFCIPFRPDECKYTVKGPATWHDNFDWIEQDTKEMKVTSDQPQEAYMWDAFGEAIEGLRSSGKVDDSWARQASMCNKLCIAVEESAQKDCKPIDVSGWFPRL